MLIPIICCFYISSTLAETEVSIFEECHLKVVSQLDKSVNGFEAALQDLSSKYNRTIAFNLNEDNLRAIASSEVTRLNYLLCTVQLKENDYNELVFQLTVRYAEKTAQHQ